MEKAVGIRDSGYGIRDADAAASPTRSKPEVDWEDIRQIVRLCALNPDEEPFRSLILRYGGEDALRRIQQFGP